MSRLANIAARAAALPGYVTRAIIRAIVMWACPDLRVEAVTAGMRADLAVAQRAIAIARIENAHLRVSLRQWQEWCDAQVSRLHNEVAFMRLDDTSGVTNAALDRRLARVELTVLPAVSDGVVELSAAQERAERMVGTGGEAS